MVPHHVTVFTCEDYYGVVFYTGIFDCLVDPAHHSVDESYVPHVMCPEGSPPDLRGDILPAGSIVHHVGIFRLILAVKHELHEVIGPDLVDHGSALGFFQECGSYRKSLRVILVHERAVIGGVRLEGTYIEYERPVLVLIYELTGFLCKIGRHLVFLRHVIPGVCGK